MVTNPYLTGRVFIKWNSVILTLGVAVAVDPRSRVSLNRIDRNNVPVGVDEFGNGNVFNPSDVIVPREVNELELLIAYETATVSFEEEPVTSRITRNARFST